MSCFIDRNALTHLMLCMISLLLFLLTADLRYHNPGLGVTPDDVVV